MNKCQSKMAPFSCAWGLLLGLFFFSALPAQNGLPFIRNYPPEAYGGHNQNWGIVQDGRGVMYFGNGHGLLEYDGVSWRLIRLSNKRLVRSLDLSADGRIFVGGYDDIGYLAPDSALQLQFVSLLPKLDATYRDFAAVWHTQGTPDGVIFVTDKYIFRWNGQQMRVWRAQKAFQFGAFLNGQLYVQDTGIGLMQIAGDSFRLVPHGEKLAKEYVKAILPFGAQDNKRMLVATRDNGLLLYDGFTIKPFHTEADEALFRLKISCFAALANGKYALGMMKDGVIVIDTAGKIRQRLQRANGLQDDAILALFEDRQHALWIGAQVGISRAETGSPLRYYTARDGIEGSAWEVVRHEGRLYFATINGLYYLEENEGFSLGSERFKRVSGVPPECWSLLSFGQSLLVGTFDGIYEIRGNQVRRIMKDYVFALHRSQQDPNRVFAGMSHGMKSLYFESGQWRDEGRLEGLDQQIRHVYETPGGKLWLSDYFHGLLQVDFSKGYSRQAPVLHFDTLSGLPPADRMIAFPTDKGLRFATLQGIFLFDEAQKRFYRDSALVQGLFNPKTGLFYATRDRRGNLWLLADDNRQSGVAKRQAEGVYVWDQSPLLRIAELPVFTIYPDPKEEQVFWIGSTNQVVRYDGKTPENHALGYQTLIRQVIANDDTLLYGGAGTNYGRTLNLAYTHNPLRFHYAAPSFDDESKNEFQYRLEGYGKDWSNWNKETYKDYTGLPEGVYRFEVRARNIYGQISEPAVFDFQIQPPFYRTWLAYFFYALLLAAGFWGLLQFARKRIEQKHRQEFKQLEYEKLRELDQLKSRFFANISHEFRTPLTLILGPIETLLAAQPEETQARQFHMIRRHARRLLRLVNQLLDLARLEGGKMKLALEFQDMLPLAKGITHSFESLAQIKKIALGFESELKSVFLYFDRDKMEQIFSNLISNAIKFTPEGGSVEVKVTNTPEGDRVQIEVIDTGSGISETQLPHIFDRFFQGDEAARITEPGTGIGLALTKELVELHQGRISVSSTDGQGTRFTLLLPYPLEHPLPEVIGEAGDAAPYFQQVAPAPPYPHSKGEAEELAGENTLLLVEDNPDMRAYIHEVMAGSFRIIEAVDGADGVEKAFEHIPDLIISDVMMPRKDGLELCDTLKNDERSSHIPIILLTAKASVESRIAGLERGADDYLAKPFNREELLLRSRNLLEGRQRLRERFASLQALSAEEVKDIQIEDAFLQKIRSIVEEHLSDATFEIDQLSKTVGMSRSQLFRKIKALTGQSPSLFIRAIRLHRAKVLLETTEMNVTEVAYEVGFSTPAYFSDAFLEAYGIRPSHFLK